MIEDSNRNSSETQKLNRIFVLEDLAISTLQIRLITEFDSERAEVVPMLSDDDLRHRFHRESVDMVVLQKGFPGIEIDDLLIFFREKIDRRQFLPVLLIVPDELDAANREHYLRLGVTAFLTPSMPDFDLVQIVESSLQRRSLHNEVAELKARIAQITTDLRVTLADLSPEFEVPSSLRSRIKVTGHVVTSQRLGGDALFFRPIGESQMGFAVFDSAVQGHEALSEVAYFKGIIETAFRLGNHSDPDHIPSIVRLMNSILLETHQGARIMTAIVGIINMESNTMEFVSAASPHPVELNKGTRQFIPINVEQGIPLGVDEDADYQLTRLNLKPASRFIIMTNGLVHQRDRDGTNYLLPMIKKVLVDNINNSVDSVSGIIQTEFEKRQTLPQFADDAAFILVDIE